jgi:hypothetical protein
MFSKPSVSLFLIIAICLAFILVVHLIEAWLLTELGHVRVSGYALRTRGCRAPARGVAAPAGVTKS